MKKIIILIVIGLVAILIDIYAALIPVRNYRFSIAYTSLFLLVSVVGMAYIAPLVRKWGEYGSKMGMALFFLGLSFFFNIVGTISQVFLSTSTFTYAPYSIFAFIGMYISWGISLIYFFSVSGYRYTKLVIYIIVLFSILGILFFIGSISFRIPFFLFWGDYGYTFVDLIIFFLTILFLFHLRKLRGGTLFLPFIFFGTGILFQFFGDFMINLRLPSGPQYGSLVVELSYCLSWMLLALTPATFPED